MLPSLVGLFAGLAVVLVALGLPATAPDFRVFWTAGRAVLAGADPYTAVIRLGDGYPYFYPYTTALLSAPLAILPLPVAWVAFGVVSGFLFARAGQVYGRGLLTGCLSAGFLEAVGAGQWGPLVVAAAVLPSLRWALVAKPNLAVPLWCWRPDRWAVVGALSLLAVSLVLLPSWPASWLDALRATNHVAPILRPGGFLLLLALLRWRTPEARLLLVLACIPQTTVLYETVPLFLIPRNRWEGYVLVVGSYVAAFWMEAFIPLGATREIGIAARWPVLLAGCYLPALVMVIRSRASTP